MTIQIETEDQATQDNAPPSPSDTPRHPMAYPDTELDFEHDPELDSEDQNILAIESTDTLDNPIGKDPIEIKDNILLLLTTIPRTSIAQLTSMTIIIQW